MMYSLLKLLWFTTVSSNTDRNVEKQDCNSKIIRLLHNRTPEVSACCLCLTFGVIVKQTSQSSVSINPQDVITEDVITEFPIMLYIIMIM